MRIGTLTLLGVLATVAVAVPACSTSDSTPTKPKGTAATSTIPTATATTTETPAQEAQKILDQRKTDYGEALRTASLKLRDRLPDLSEIKQIDTAPDDASKKTAYEKLVDDMIGSPEFSAVMIKYFQDTFKTGQEGDIQANVDRSAAARFAAELVVEGRAYTELFTATDNTCPTYDDKANTFTPTPCPLPDNGQQGPTVGVLTDPGLLGQYFANMAFRRTRFIQETFVCSKFPAEFSANPVPMGNGVFTGAIPFNTIMGKQNNPQAKIDFQDTSSVICANCHVNLNHIAPLFINYDANGALQTDPQVQVPVEGSPPAQMSDYLVAGEGLEWRSGVPITDIASLGKAMAADAAIPKCAVNRIWNYAMSRGDIVNDLATVPDVVTQPYVDSFKSSGMITKETIRAIFKSDDFTKF